MKKISSVTLVLLFFLAPLGASQKSIDNNEVTRIKEKNDWFGKVESSRAYINDNKETVIEWYCHKYEIIDNADPAELGKTVKIVEVAEKEIVHFVVTIRSPSMPIEKAEEAAVETTQKTHYVSWQDAEIEYEGFYLGKKALYLGGGSGRITDQLKVIYVK